MTEATPAPALLTHRRVLRIAVPIVIANATVPLLGAVDTGVIGQLGEAVPIGAVGIGSIIITAVYWVFGFLRMGTTGLTSQALGARDADEVRAILLRVLIAALCGGLLMILAQGALLRAAFALSPASAEVEALARDYITIRIYSAPAAIAVFGITGWLIGQERTRAVLGLQLWMNGLNVLLDLWFVLGLGRGVEGVAAATFLSEWSGLVIGLWMCRSAFVAVGWRDRGRVFDPARLRRMLSVNGDIMLRTLLLQAAFLSFMFIGAGLGDVTLAANQVLLQFLHVTAFALDGFAFAAESLVGQALGARRRADLRRAAIITSQWGLGIVAALSLAFAGFGPRIVALLTTAPDVRAAAGSYLFWMVLAPLAGVASWMLDGVFIGATHTRDMRIAMLQSVAVYAVALAVLMPLLGNHGLWAALMVFFAARAATLALRYPALERSADVG